MSQVSTLAPVSYTSTLTSKNQTTIPKAIVEALKIKPSSKLYFEIEPDGIVRIRTKSATARDFVGTFKKTPPGKVVSIEEMTKAAKAGAAKRYLKSVQ